MTDCLTFGKGPDFELQAYFFHEFWLMCLQYEKTPWKITKPCEKEIFIDLFSVTPTVK